MKKLLPLLVVALLLLVFLQRSKLGDFFGNDPKKENPKPSPNEPTELSYKGKKMSVTRHAKCRMGCRFINEKEIMEVLNQDKQTETRNNGECPALSYEGKSNGKKLRIVVADCPTPRLVTVIELDAEHKCDCE